MAILFRELAFNPSVGELVPDTPQGKLVILTGGNNSGKSAYLKKAIEDPSKLYVGVNRFYSFHSLPFYTRNDAEVTEWFRNQQQTLNAKFQNYEQSFFNCSTAITRLSDARRQTLFDTFEELFGTKIAVASDDVNNAFSNRYISVGGDSLSVTSSGTRLFLGILAALMDDRFVSVAIDEPELGLSPMLQRRLADIIVGGYKKDELYPHNPNILLSTHSHLFLDKLIPGNNYVVSKQGNLISATKCLDFHEIHDIQFRLLGNDLSQLFLPDAVAFVEGETDRLYLEAVLKLHLPKLRVIVQACGGDIAKRLSYWSDSIGDLQLSPYRNRTLVIYDSVKQPGIERACAAAGLPSGAAIVWANNGIEYVYPVEILRHIYRDQSLEIGTLAITGDEVSHNGISYKKMDLCRQVCERLRDNTELPEELRSKFLAPLSVIS